QYYDKLVINGEIGTRAALIKQWGMIDSATIEEINSIVNRIEIDPSFKEFYQWVIDQNIQFLIVSDGFKTYIQKILQNHQISIPDNKIKANDMKLVSNKIEVNFLTNQCDHGCANCKHSHVKTLKRDNTSIIYIGDGLSDIFPARELGDIIFAKEDEDLAKKLVDDERVIIFSNFDQIKNEIEKLLKEN
ncbi:MAG: MtnX-like HAD-IB family phosphatase, partial [Candidatus Heimdallarchaeaceae archaeon]